MKRRILIRFDDLCPTMDWKQWKRAVDILKQYQITPLIGVIPDCKDPDLLIDESDVNFWSYIKQLQRQGYTIAMHGCFHLYNTKERGLVANAFHSEFAGLSYKKQRELINYGKNIIEKNGIYTDVFFAPAHSYDRNTLKALKEEGFKYISDGKSRKAYRLDDIICLPCNSVRILRKIYGGYHTIVFHPHEWSNPKKEKEYYQLVSVCKTFAQDIVSFEEYIKQPTGIYFFQRIQELAVVFIHRNIIPILVKCKNIIKE